MGAATADNNGNGSMADPLFLFACGLEWWRRADTHAGWELIRAAKSPDRDAKAVGWRCSQIHKRISRLILIQRKKQRGTRC